MKIFKELNKLGYKHYTEHTIEELDNLPLNSEERIMEQALVLRWFREKYALEHKILRDSYGCRYQITKVTPTSLEDIDCKGQYSNTSYPKAELECLKKLIEIVKENKI